MADLTGIGSITGAVGASIGALGSIGTGITNYIQQKDLLNYQKQLQREIFQREDTAIQRRASDIKAAGGNPALAWENGTGAGAGSAVPVQAPQFDSSTFGTLAHSSASFYDIDRLINQNKITDAQVANIDASTSKTYVETEVALLQQLGIMEQTAKTEEEKLLIKKEREKLAYDLDLSRNMGLRTNDSTLPVANTITSTYNRIFDRLMEFKEGNISDKDLYGALVDIGLMTVPGLAIFKGFKGAKNAWRLRKGIEFVRTFGIPKSGKDRQLLYLYLRDRNNTIDRFKALYKATNNYK